MTSPSRFDGSANIQDGLNVKSLFKVVNDATASVKVKLAKIASNRSSISIGDMFEMQMLMNHLAQLSDMSTNVVSASNQAIMSMSRNVKG
ncbi:MAG: DUF5407 family protein [Parachlamydiaceae bacterium]|nr:DUF5407 family protein [Parachlamydiaceae bacterium]